MKLPAEPEQAHSPQPNGPLPADWGLAALFFGFALVVLGVFQWMELLLSHAGETSFCAVNSRFNCATVWAAPIAKQLQAWTTVPVAGWGVVYGWIASALAFWLLWARLRGRVEAAAVRAAGWVSAVGLVGALGLFLVTVQMGVFCLTCLTTYVLIIGYALSTWRLRRALPAGAASPPGLEFGVPAGLLLVGYLAMLYPASRTPSVAPELPELPALPSLAAPADGAADADPSTGPAPGPAAPSNSAAPAPSTAPGPDAGAGAGPSTNPNRAAPSGGAAPGTPPAPEAGAAPAPEAGAAPAPEAAAAKKATPAAAAQPRPAAADRPAAPKAPPARAQAATSNAAALRSFLAGLPAEQRQLLSNLLDGVRRSPHPDTSAYPPRERIGRGRVHLVDFSDVRCGHCAHLVETLRELRAKLPAGSFSHESRYYPLDAECNPQLSPRMTDGSGIRCVGAKALICAQGKPQSEAFRRLVFENQRRLDIERVFSLAKQAGLDATQLERCVTTPETTHKLHQDIAYAASYHLEGTPMVLVNGQKAPGYGALLYALILADGDPRAPAFATLPPPQPGKRR